jgi:mRNA-degrading endonuclease RelE of RelBE toxin-antitoxin system
LTELEGLQRDPFSGNVKKIKGKKDIFRLRSGSFRVYFRIVPSSRCIEILLFDQRGAIKNKTLERL